METVAVSQAPVVSEAPAAVAPPVERGAVAAFPPAVQDLARFFLSLTGSSSQGAVVGAAGTTVAVSRAGVQLYPSAPGGEAVTCAAPAAPALSTRPSGSAAVPGSSDQRLRGEEVSRSNRHRRRSSSSGTARSSKRRHRDRSPSPGRSSHLREASY